MKGWQFMFLQNRRYVQVSLNYIAQKIANHSPSVSRSSAQWVTDLQYK